MLFKLKADCSFEAKDIQDALMVLGNYLLFMSAASEDQDQSDLPIVLTGGSFTIEQIEE
jgi:hypothetical protein